MTDAPILAVTVATAWRPLVTLQALHDRLGVTAGTNDPELLRLIRARSDAIAAWCGIAPDQLGRRTFASETMTATWLSADCARSSRLVLPWRIPLISVTALVEAGVTLDAGEYRTFPMAAMIERIGADGESPQRWSSGPIVVTYTAGWVDAANDASTMPSDLQDACLEECFAAYMARDRDPALRSENLPDVHQYTVAYGQDGARDRLLPETMSMLRSYRSEGIG
ncbi:MAG: hypothetical protein AB7P02_30415 [Alphaproteobacteria bacterium]